MRTLILDCITSCRLLNVIIPLDSSSSSLSLFSTLFISVIVRSSSPLPSSGDLLDEGAMQWHNRNRSLWSFYSNLLCLRAFTYFLSFSCRLRTHIGMARSPVMVLWLFLLMDMGSVKRRCCFCTDPTSVFVLYIPVIDVLLDLKRKEMGFKLKHSIKPSTEERGQKHTLPESLQVMRPLRSLTQRSMEDLIQPHPAWRKKWQHKEPLFFIPKRYKLLLYAATLRPVVIHS